MLRMTALGAKSCFFENITCPCISSYSLETVGLKRGRSIVFALIEPSAATPRAEIWQKHYTRTEGLQCG